MVETAGGVREYEKRESMTALQMSEPRSNEEVHERRAVCVIWPSYTGIKQPQRAA